MNHEFYAIFLLFFLNVHQELHVASFPDTRLELIDAAELFSCGVRTKGICMKRNLMQSYV